MHLSLVRTSELRGGRATSTFRVCSADLQQPLDAITKAHPNRDTTVRAAWATGEYSHTQIAAHFGGHFTTVGRSVRRVIQLFECDDARPGPATCMLRSVEILYGTPFRNPKGEIQVLVTTEVYGMALNLLNHLGSRGLGLNQQPTTLVKLWSKRLCQSKISSC
jgi:hypothetical protein